MFTQDDCVSLEKLLSMQFLRIKSFFMRYFGNFDFNVRYCGII